MKELEEELVVRERRLLRLVVELRGAGPEAHAQLSTLVHEEKGKKKKKRRKPGSLFTCSS